MPFLTTAPLWLTALILIVAPVAIATTAPFAVRRYIALDMLRENNEIAGFKFAVVGVIYAVLLAFAVVVVWEKFNDAEATVSEEAGAAAAVYRLGHDLGGGGQALDGALVAYLEAAITDDWAAMERGHGSPAVRRALDAVYTASLGLNPPDARGRIVLGELFGQLDHLAQARRARIVLASGTVPGVVWLVLFVDAFVTVGFTLFFGTINLRAQTAMTGALAILVFSGLFVVIVIDRPFAGTVRVGPEALVLVLDDLGGQARP